MGGVNITISEGLKRFRKDYTLTQKQVATAINLAESAYQRYEYGKVIPSANVLIDIADYFNVSLDYLAGRTDNPEINK